MAHHKRKGPKSTRAGCLMCKPHKAQWAKGSGDYRTPAEVRADEGSVMIGDPTAEEGAVLAAWRILPAPLGDKLLEVYEDRREALETVDPDEWGMFANIIRKAQRALEQ